MFDLWAEIRKLPGIDPNARELLRATRTDDARGVVPPVVPTGGISQLRVATNGTHAETSENGRNFVSGAVGVGCRRTASRCVMGDRGLEPLTSCVSSRRSSQLS